MTDVFPDMQIEASAITKSDYSAAQFQGMDVNASLPDNRLSGSDYPIKGPSAE